MSELSFRLSREGDIPELTRLWREVFGDDEDFISEFFRLLWRPEYCRVAEAEGKLAAMGFCLPGPVANGLSCAYIYAMATAEPYRGRCAAQRIGLELIRGAFDSGVHLVATLPAEESLCRWYESRLGMAPQRRARRGISPELARVFPVLRRALAGHPGHALGHPRPRRGYRPAARSGLGMLL